MCPATFSTGMKNHKFFIPALFLFIHIEHCCNHQEIGGDLRCPHATWLRGINADVQSLMSVSTQPGGRPTIVFAGDVSSTRQHCIRGPPLKKKRKELLLACEL